MEFSIYKRINNIPIIIFISLTTLTLLFLIVQLSFSLGRQKEKESKMCIGAGELVVYEESLKSAKYIWLEGIKIKERELITCKEQIETQKGETKRWKDSYIWLNSQEEDKE